MPEGSKKRRVLLVDDKKNLLSLLRKVLEPDLDIRTATDGAVALQMLRDEPCDVVVSDLRMPGLDGLQLLRATRSLETCPIFILMTAYASLGTAIQALRLGAHDYLSKPFEPEEARAMILKAARASAMPFASFQAEGDELLPGLLSRSAKMRELAEFIRRVAASRSTVLILGETGTGKELVARAVHGLSPRRDARFVAVNCAAIPSELLESELFGFKKGSFSGATQDRKGLFEESDGGTLFLDEIGELRLSLQAKLTRVLEERAIRRIGSPAEKELDLRLVAATHRDLQELTQKEEFREDLLYRLNVACVHIPPLRERRCDITLLATNFLHKISQDLGREIQGFDESALEQLRLHDWPGNVRQLKAAIERACVLAKGSRITLEDVASSDGQQRKDRALLQPLVNLPWTEASREGQKTLARYYLRAVLDMKAGDVAAAARHAGVERESFYRLLRKYGVPRSSPRSDP